MTPRLRSLLPLLVVPLLVLLFFHRLAFSGLILARGDTFLYFYPYWGAAAAALFEQVRLPLWNAALFMGAPFLANSQAGVLYPLNWPFWALLPTPYAVSGSILLHLFVAGWGAYAAARRCYHLRTGGALLAGLLFALGGYLTAQVEHVNQLQGLAWLPWYFAVWGDGPALAGKWWERLRLVLALSTLIALQFLSGHTQSLFISGVGFSVWLFVSLLVKGQGGRHARPLLNSGTAHLIILAPAAVLALALVAGQLLPTLELMQHSSRQGGLALNEALSFSLHPLLLTGSLLPGYGRTVFTEFVAFLPLTGLLLAVVGAWSWRSKPEIIPLLILAVLGLSFALGVFNPIYVVLAHLPGFDFFRVPARWLALYGLGMALLAGIGFQRFQDEGIKKRELVVGVSLLVILMLWGVVAAQAGHVIAAGAETVVTAPSALTWLGWFSELIIAILLLTLWRGPTTQAQSRILLPTAIIALAVSCLFLASRVLPYNQLTTPAAYFDLRPPTARLLAWEDCRFYPERCDEPPGRILSLSDILFDLGDQTEIESVYKDALTASALFDFLVASKHKAVMSPNLPLGYDLASVDGFDGGLLPLRSYSEMMSTLLLKDASTTDGRLREYLNAVPEERWLDLFNVQYLITDKTADEWREGVFFDRQHNIALQPGEESRVGYIPDYEATELWLLSSSGAGLVQVDHSGGQVQTLEPVMLAEGVWRVLFPRPLLPEALTLQAAATGTGWQVEAVALVDERDGTFQPLTPGAYRLTHSGDVKIYHNLDVLPRAYMVYSWEWEPDSAGALDRTAAESFRPDLEAVIVGSGSPVTGTAPDGAVVAVNSYEPEHISIQTDSRAAGLLVLSDAHYPGWAATLDNEPVDILLVNGFFRGVMVPAGRHEVRFDYAPQTIALGGVISLTALLIWVSLLIVALWAARWRAAGK